MNKQQKEINLLRVKSRLSTIISKLISAKLIDEKLFIKDCGLSEDKALYFLGGRLAEITIEELGLVLANLDIKYRNKKPVEFEVWGAMNIAIGSHMHDADSIDNDDSYDCFTSYKIHDLENIKRMAAHTANAEIIKMIENKG